MRKQILSRFAFVVGIAVVAITLALPSSLFENILGKENAMVQRLDQFKVSLGLDLKGGTELDYKIDLTEALAQNADDDLSNNVNIDRVVQSVRDSLEKRVNPIGVGEIVVKLSSINDERHVLIQMPPDTDVEKAKRDAEKNNKLEFFEEDPSLENNLKNKISTIQLDLTPENWSEMAKNLEENGAKLEILEKKTREAVGNNDLANQLFNTPVNTIIPGVFNDTTYSISQTGQLELKQNFAIAFLTDKSTTSEEAKAEDKVTARHILFSYEGAENAGDTPYKTKEAAKAKAEEILQQIKDGGDFAELAKKFSTGPSGVKGGDLGEFGQGAMVPAFNDACFALTEPALVDHLVETGFGFHIIEVTDIKKAEETTTKEVEVVTYQMLTWDKTDINWIKTKLGGKQLDVATVGMDQIGKPLVNLKFDSEGGKLFGELTDAVSKRTCQGGPCRLGIKVGGNWISTPTVREPIYGGQAQISGNFTAESAHELADSLNLGAIDAPVSLSGQTTVKAELGEQQLKNSLKAAFAGFLATIIFMIIFYRFAGFIAALSLIIYAALYVMILKIWPTGFGGPIVLSLSGAAGVALSIGLAVDGNILIFERMKEELRKGRSLVQAVDLGFERAWMAIRDSNLTTLMICIILSVLGSSIIKGFAITLIVGTLLSMFTAITVSRNLIRFFLLFKVFKKTWLFGVKKSEIGKKVAGAKIRTRKKKKTAK